MASLDVSFSLHKQGPLFDDLAPEIIHAWLDDVKKDIAQEGVNELRSFVMDKSGRATGRYQAEIITSTLMYNDIKIHDPVVYGPWLEGSSKRNRSTRFKGYHLWRKTAQALQERAPDIAEAKMPDLVNRLGG
jgi:hypothetical protein